jgi:DNA-binding SARP family transcriptional activator
MASLYAKALDAGIEARYVREVIRKRGLLPPKTAPAQNGNTHGLGAAQNLANWPWFIKIRMLGTFEVLVDDMQIDPGQKSNQRSTLLKLLAASGQNGISVNRLSDILWPGAEGDKALHALEMATHRLRKLLGNKDSIQIRNQLMRLNDSLCWVDIKVFVDGIDYALRLFNSNRHGEARAMLEKSLSLYSGHFLAHDQDESWLLSVRERLRMKYLLGIETLLQLYERNRQREKALEFCREAIEIDDVFEELYYRYMRCCVTLGRKHEAISAYQRLAHAMKMVEMTPSEQTFRLIKSM